MTRTIASHYAIDTSRFSVSICYDLEGSLLDRCKKYVSVALVCALTKCLATFLSGQTFSPPS